MYSNWILKQNLVTWLEVLSAAVEYSFDSMDRDSFECAIGHTDRERDQWFHYELSGRIKLALQVAQDVGTDVVAVRVACPADLEPRVDTATAIAQEFTLVR